MSLTLEEEKELIKLKEESQRKLIAYQHEQDLGLIRFKARKKEHLEDYKSQLIQDRDKDRSYQRSHPKKK